MKNSNGKSSSFLIKIPETEWRYLEICWNVRENSDVSLRILDCVNRNDDLKLLPRETSTTEQHPHAPLTLRGIHPHHEVGAYNEYKTHRGVS